MKLPTVMRAILMAGLVTGFLIPEEAKAQVADSTAQAASVVVQQPAPATVQEAPKKKAWYDKISLRGYAQVRYNRLLETNPNLKCDQCDKSIGEGGGVFLRRGRLIFSGDVSDRLSIYIQPDFASSASSNALHFFQLRDAYFDVSLDKAKVYRFRVGQSKIPYGFENLQSSSNRLALDRNDGLNSAIANERDLGIFFYWTPEVIQERFKMLTDAGLKGTGNYGVFGIGIYNGQTANKPEANNTQHIVTRFSYPLLVGSKQIIEPGIQAYKGRYVVTPDQVSSGVGIAEKYLKEGFDDERIAASLVVYPQPFGFQAEYNVGRGPEFNPENNAIEVKNLHGGYAQAMYRKEVGSQVLIPFVKVQHYEGGKKHERDAPGYSVYETEIGVEWLVHKSVELTADYSIGDRTIRNAQNFDNRQHGSRLRLQAQFNF
ncbi:porin [Pontibacter ramchanderi]|uniref:Phosphate-selective porin O/P n=1 Tax=Pontibacter ramchanderi TaxID=1179743 RepID=A0A2N3UBU8_9BACT|nr:porin [Pontibacter ramchanderi]PKV66844.1 phosphate-selective porin O/P [Pontibacter ramchanderi]